MTTIPAIITFPIPVAEITDDGLRRIEGACRSERLRRARLATDHPAPAPDTDDAIIERLPPDQIAAIAKRLDGEVCAGGQTGGLAY